MKKIILCLIIFSICSILITGVLINVKNNKKIKDAMNNDTVNNLVEKTNNEVNNLVKETNNEVNDLSEEKNNNTVNELREEKTLDLRGRYNENDLEIEEISIKIENSNDEIKIPQIKGLKDKQVENKVNSDIKNRIIEITSEVSGKISTNNYFIDSNFSNVICIVFYHEIEGERTTRYYNGLNYELINGDRLKFEDLFKSDADLYSIVRRMYYGPQENKHPVVFKNDSRFELYDIYFNKEKNTWMGKYHGYTKFVNGDHYYESIEGEMEYIPNLTEEDISNKIIEFMNKSEKNFCFYSKRIISI